MDIMRLPLEGQVSPAPWLVACSRADVPALISKALTIHPNAGINELVGQLAAWGMQVSGLIVCMWMMKWKEQAEREKPDEVPGKAASNPNDADLWKASAAVERQYCCGVRVTKQQIRGRYKVFEHTATWCQREEISHALFVRIKERSRSATCRHVRLRAAIVGLR